MLPLIEAMKVLSETLHHANKARVLRPSVHRLTKKLAMAFRAQGKKFVKGLVKHQDRFTVTELDHNLPRTLITITLREALTNAEINALFEQSEAEDNNLFIQPIQSEGALMLGGALSSCWRS